MGLKLRRRLRAWREASHRRARRAEARKASCVALGDRNASFRRRGWATVDLEDADHEVDLRSEDLPFRDDSLRAISSSHLIEHVDRDAGLELLRKCHRVLEPGGCLRISTPDLDLLIDRYRVGDWRWFLESNGHHTLRSIVEKGLAPESLLLHNCFVGWLASYSGKVGVGGGPTTDRELVDRQLETLSKYEFRDWCVSLLDASRPLAHVHVMDFDELSTMLQEAGFRSIHRSEFGKSGCPAMLDPTIDREARRACSLYAEAFK